VFVERSFCTSISFCVLISNLCAEHVSVSGVRSEHKTEWVRNCVSGSGVRENDGAGWSKEQGSCYKYGVVSRAGFRWWEAWGPA